MLMIIPSVVAAVSYSERVHVNGVYNRPHPSSFTLWFPNGTILSNHLTGFQIPFDNRNALIFSFVVTNDIDSPINASSTVRSINTPSNVVANISCKAADGSSITIPPRHNASMQVIGSFSANSSYTAEEPFSYSFDFTVTCVSPNGSSYQDVFVVYGNSQYPSQPAPSTEPEKTTTPTPPATAQPTTTENPNTTDPTATPTSSTSASSTPISTDTPQVPEFSPLVPVVALLILLPVLALAVRKLAATRKLKTTTAVLVIAALLFAGFSVGASTAQTSTPATSSSGEVKFSLWFTNGTAFPSSINSGTFKYGNMQLNIGGIMVSPYAYGSQFMPETNLIVLRNDGNVPITVQAALSSVNVPPNIELSLQCYPLASSWAPPNSQWMGYDNLATGNTVGPGQCQWLGIIVAISQSTNIPSGTPTFTFNYSFDLNITAVQT